MMWIVRVALRRPYTFVCGAILVFIGGLVAIMTTPVDIFPVLFAIGRTPGWLAQWQEMLLDKEQKIARPRQVYIGPPKRDYVTIEKRS